MENNIPCVSLGLPVYNGQNFVRQALDAILSQTFDDFELIICDNASTDDTEAICREYEARDRRIRYHRNPKNLGAAKNYNLVFELAQGKYFAWMNHDDLYAEEYLEKCITSLERQPSAILAYSKSFLIDEKGEHIAELFYDLKINSENPYERFQRFHECAWKSSISGGYPEKNGIWTPVYGLMRREVLSKTGKIGLHISADTTLLEELVLLGKFCLVPTTLFFKREHPKQSMQLQKSFSERILWFDPAKKGKLLFPQWRLLWEQFRAINRIQLSWKQKLYCYSEIPRRIRLQWRILSLELFINLIQLVPIKFKVNRNSIPDVWY